VSSSLESDRQKNKGITLLLLLQLLIALQPNSAKGRMVYLLWQLKTACASPDLTIQALNLKKKEDLATVDIMWIALWSLR